MKLSFLLDYGESESIILYNELQADFLLIDDKKARNIAELRHKLYWNYWIVISGKR